MFVTAVCVLFLLKLEWPKNMNFFPSSALTLSSFSTLILVTLVFRLLILIHLFPASSCNISHCHFSWIYSFFADRSAASSAKFRSPSFVLKFQLPFGLLIILSMTIIEGENFRHFASLFHTRSYVQPNSLSFLVSYSIVIEEYCHSHDVLLNTKPLDDDP